MIFSIMAFCQGKRILFIFILANVNFLVFLIICNNTRQLCNEKTTEDIIEDDFDLCMEKCGLWKTASFTDLSASNVGTCGTRATSRGDNQSVISFSFYGKTDGGRQYFKGIEGNAELMEKIYPGWTMRVYHNLTQSEDVNLLCQLSCHYNKVLDICYVGDTPGFGNLFQIHPFMWRFLPLVDSQVNYMMSRDLDGRFTARESAAVSEWLQSGRPLHVMRDHVSHLDEVMGGMWGAKVQGYLPVWQEAFLNMMKYLQGKVDYGEDQTALKKYVFTLADTYPGWLIAHDSYHCRDENLLKGEMRAFPTQRLMNEQLNYVGSHHNNPTLKKECPVPCRRQANWTYC